MKKEINVLFGVVIAIQSFMVWTRMAGDGGMFLNNVLHSQWAKPFVYRALIPFTSQTIEYLLGIPVYYVGLVLFVLSAVGFYLSMQYLISGVFASFLAYQFLFSITIHETKIYDYATAAFFALALALILKRKYGVYLIVFFLATLNRETSFLLVLVFMVYNWKKMEPDRYIFLIANQVIIYILVRELLYLAFWDAPGADAMMAGIVLREYLINEVVLFLSLLGVAFMGGQWKSMGEYSKILILCIVIPQIGLHILFGIPYELRVFAESVPAILFSLSGIVRLR